MLKHERYCTGIKIVRKELPGVAVCPHKRTTKWLRKKTCCKFGSHEYVWVCKYAIEHLQCVNCGSRFFRGMDRMNFFGKIAHEKLKSDMNNLFRSSFTNKVTDNKTNNELKEV